MSGVIIPAMASPYERCLACVGSAQPGARAMMAYWLEVSRPVGTSMGIYNCREVRGSTFLSQHSCGSAVDLGVPAISGSGHPTMWAFLNRLAPYCKRLGVQHIIFARKVWSASRPPEGATYNGVHPHWDHTHLELTRAAAQGLTLATLRSVLGTSNLNTPTIPLPPPVHAGEDIMLGLDVGRRDDPVVREPRVGTLQAFLVDAGFLSDVSEVDGAAGNKTRSALNLWKQSVGITSALSGGEGVIGSWEYARMMGAGGGTGTPGPQGPKGDKGDKGDPGTLSGDVVIEGSIRTP